MKVLWFGYMEEFACDRNDLILNPLFNFELMKGLELRVIVDWRLFMADEKCLGTKYTKSCVSSAYMR